MTGSQNCNRVRQSLWEWRICRWLYVVAVLAIVIWPVDAPSLENHSMKSNAASYVTRVLNPGLRASGFVRHGRNWYRYGSDSILVVNIQQSRLPAVAYVNLGVYYYKYGKNERPKIVDCHVDASLNGVVTNPLLVIGLLDLTSDIPSELRTDELANVVRAYAVPWLERMATIDSARNFLASNPAAAHIAPEARVDIQVPQEADAK